MRAGTYTLSIIDNWNASLFGGTKAIVFSEVGFLGIITLRVGPKNEFLAIELLVVGCFCLLVSIFVLGVRFRKYGDTSLLSWNKKND